MWWTQLLGALLGAAAGAAGAVAGGAWLEDRRDERSARAAARVVFEELLLLYVAVLGAHRLPGARAPERLLEEASTQRAWRQHAAVIARVMPRGQLDVVTSAYVKLIAFVVVEDRRRVSGSKLAEAVREACEVLGAMAQMSPDQVKERLEKVESAASEAATPPG